MRYNSNSRARLVLAASLALLMVLACALPAGAAGRASVSSDGLYITDDGAYGVYVLNNDPGAVGIAKCLLETVDADLTVPARVSLNGAQVPVHALGYKAYEDHDEINTVRILEGVSYMSGEPFSGCDNISQITLPPGGFTLMNGFFDGIGRCFEVLHPKYSGPGSPLQYVEVALSTTSPLNEGEQLGITVSLKNPQGNFSAYLYLNGLDYVSMDPMDAEGHEWSLQDNLPFIRLGYDPASGTDFGTTRTVYLRPNGMSHMVSANLTGAIPENGMDAKWSSLDTLEYYLPCVLSTPDEPYVISGYPDFLPLPVDVEPVQKSVLDGTNAVRAKVGASPLTLSEVLCQAAMVRATEMALAEDMNHTRPNGEDWYTVLENYASSLGENIAEADGTLEQMGPLAVDMWEHSPVHYENMVKPDFTEMGLGCARGKSGTLYCCQLFSNWRQTGNVTFYQMDSVQMNGMYTPDADSAPQVTPEPTASPTPDQSWTTTPSSDPEPSYAGEPTVAELVSTPPSAVPSEPTPGTPLPPSPSQSASDSDAHGIDPSQLTLTGGLGIAKAGSLHYITGLSAGSPTILHDLLAKVQFDGGQGLWVVDPEENARGIGDEVATGDQLWVLDNDSYPTGVFIVVKGDVLGTGKPSVTQLVRIARAYTGTEPLDGLAAAAADVNGDGSLGLSDIVMAANQLPKSGR